jgi:hypothetical protein
MGLLEVRAICVIKNILKKNNMNKLPEKWYIEVTNENKKMLNKFKLSKGKIQIMNYDCVCCDGFGWYYLNIGLQTYTKITTEQFKQLVLKEQNMEQKEIKIQIPEWYEIDKELSTFEKIVFKAKVKELPKSWEELEIVNGFYTNSNSNVGEANCSTIDSSRNIWPTKEYAEASIALAQLLQLTRVYNAGWEPDWTDDNCKHCIYISADEIQLDTWILVHHILSFETRELAQQFLNNFKDLIEIAKPLL